MHEFSDLSEPDLRPDVTSRLRDAEIPLRSRLHYTHRGDGVDDDGIC
jgi:hypothetical protein